MTPRIRRLQSDYDRVVASYSNHPLIRLVSAEGSPPEKYTFEFLLPGLVAQAGDAFGPGSTHQCEVFLPLDYPRRPPFCRMITPLFHPNVDPRKVCIGDHWSAGQSLPEMVIHIAEMICYQNYNIKSPLNAQAAAWAGQNADKLPLYKAAIST